MWTNTLLVLPLLSAVASLYSSKSAVTILSAKNFKGAVKENDRLSVVEFLYVYGHLRSLTNIQAHLGVATVRIWRRYTIRSPTL